jgi:hypothetical protein
MAKLTPEQRQRRREEQGAARKNAKLRKEAPLFAGLLSEHTPETEHANWARNKAEAAERLGFVFGMQILDECYLRQWLLPRFAQIVGASAYAGLIAYCQRTYPSVEFWYGFWCRVLTGDRIEFKLERVDDRQPGQPAVVCTEWYQCQHMSRKEFYARYPFKRQPPLEGGFEAEAEAILATIGRPADR